MEEVSHFKKYLRPKSADNLPELLESLLTTEDKTPLRKLFNSTCKDLNPIRANWSSSQEERTSQRRVILLTLLLKSWSLPRLNNKTQQSTSSPSQELRQDRPQLSWPRRLRRPEFTESSVNCKSTLSTQAWERREQRKQPRKHNSELIIWLDIKRSLHWDSLISS